MITIRHDLRPGDVDTIVRLHGDLYAEEHGWDSSFGKYVAEGIGEFVAGYDPARDRIWIAEKGGKLAGVVAIVHTDADSAQLRWFLVLPEARGRGLGQRLIDEAIEFCRQRGCRSIFLWTVAGLDAAAKLYVRTRFTLTETVTHRRWGKEVIEQRYDLNLNWCDDEIEK